MAIRFKWDGEHVVIENIYGNYISRVMYAKNAYHDGDKIVVISSTGQQVVFSANGIRTFR